MDINGDIKSLYKENTIIDIEYDRLILSYMIIGAEIEKLTNKSFIMQNDVLMNKEVLRNMILNSNLCKNLDKDNVLYTLSDLKSYLINYSNIKEKVLLEKLIEEYELSEKLENLEQKHITLLTHGLSKILKKEFSKYHEKGIIDRNGTATVELIPKTFHELEYDYREALDDIEDLYFNDSLINRENYMRLGEMINRVFLNYKLGMSKLPISEFKEKEKNQKIKNKN